MLPDVQYSIVSTEHQKRHLDSLILRSIHPPPPCRDPILSSLAVVIVSSQKVCVDIFLSKDHSKDGTITIEDHDFGAAFIKQHDMNKDGKVTLNEYLYMCALKSNASKKWMPNRGTGL